MLWVFEILRAKPGHDVPRWTIQLVFECLGHTPPLTHTLGPNNVHFVESIIT